MKVFLAGQVGFYNRGCEALVRAIVQSVTDRFGRCSFVVPSNDAATDTSRWPEAASYGVRFIPFHRIPGAVKWWDRGVRRLPMVANVWWPTPELPPTMAREMADCDMVIVTGGDVLSLDYAPASLLRWVAQIESGLRRGVPVVLWASSLGPFGANPAIERRMAAHLARYASVSTRESHSQGYALKLGLADTVQTADPAFLMTPEAIDAGPLLPEPGPGGVLGFNVSPVLLRARAAGGGVAQLEADILAFWKAAVHDFGMSVALIPHVDSPEGQGPQSDTGYMRQLLQRAGDLGARIRLVPHTLNAAQLKSVLGSCRFFIGARTHSTIGALSMGVPTASIAYSVKARGINEDMFGHLRHMIDTPQVSLPTLTAALQTLQTEEADIRRHLAERMPQIKLRSKATVELVYEAMNRPSGGQAQQAYAG